MKIYATGRTVATRNSKKQKKNDHYTAPNVHQALAAQLLIIPVVGYNHCSDWFNICNAKSQ